MTFSQSGSMWELTLVEEYLKEVGVSLQQDSHACALPTLPSVSWEQQGTDHVMEV